MKCIIYKENINDENYNYDYDNTNNKDYDNDNNNYIVIIIMIITVLIIMFIIVLCNKAHVRLQKIVFKLYTKQKGFYLTRNQTITESKSYVNGRILMTRLRFGGVAVILARFNI